MGDDNYYAFYDSGSNTISEKYIKQMIKEMTSIDNHMKSYLSASESMEDTISPIDAINRVADKYL